MHTIYSHKVTRVAVVAFLAISMIQSELPEVVTSGINGGAPSDAIILFDGRSVDALSHPDGSDLQWSLDGDVLVVGKQSAISRQTFGDAQIHVEFSTPEKVEGEGQSRGNSGVYIQGRYEVQILDSFENETYADGQCGAIYGIRPPSVNVSRGPGIWQSYDIIFRAPKFDGDGTKAEPGTLTVFHNGVLIQDHVKLTATTTASLLKEGPEDGPLYLQSHSCPVRYRNIWIRHLEDA